MSCESLVSLPVYSYVHVNSRLSEILKAGLLTKKNKLPSDVAIRTFSLQTRPSVVNSADPVLAMMVIFNLTDFSAFLFAKVLEDTLQELQILECTNNHLKVMQVETDMPRHLAEKFSVRQPRRASLDGVTREDVTKDEHKIKKLCNDRHAVTDAMFQSFLDLVMNRSFESLAQAVAYIYDRNVYFENLVREEAENRITRRELGKQLRTQRIHIASVHYALDATIDRLSAEVEDSGLLMAGRDRYMTRWQVSRNEQHTQTIDDIESTTFNSVMEYKVKINDEHRVHAEVMRFMEVKIDELLRQVDGAMDRYDKNIERIDLQIQIMKNNYQNQRDDRMDIQKTFSEHEKEMTEWVTFKKDREDNRLYRLKMNEAACAVQAWWRGLLVRLQIGPYKVKKGGKKAKKSEA